MEPLEAGDNLSGQEISLPALALEEHHLTLVAFFQLVVEAKSWERWLPIMIQPPKGLSITGSSTTVKAASAVGWFDRFGIQRLAVDRGLLEDEDKLEGVFVLLSEGDSV